MNRDEILEKRFVTSSFMYRGLGNFEEVKTHPRYRLPRFLFVPL